MVNAEIKSIIGKFIRRFNWKLDPDYKLVMMMTASYGPQESLDMLLEPREKSICFVDL